MSATSVTLNDVWPFSGAASAPSVSLVVHAWRRVTTQACRCCTELVETPAERWATQQVAQGEISDMQWSEAVIVVMHDALCALRHACLLAGCADAGAATTGTVRGRVTSHSAAVVAALHRVREGMLCDDCFAPMQPATVVQGGSFVEEGLRQLHCVTGVPPAAADAAAPAWCGSDAREFFGACAPVSVDDMRTALDDRTGPVGTEASAQAGIAGADAKRCAVSAPPQCALHAHGEDLWSLSGYKGGSSGPAGFASASVRLVEALQSDHGVPKEEHLHAMLPMFDEIVPLAPSARRALSWLLRRAGVPSKPFPLHCERPDRVRAAALGVSLGADAGALLPVPRRLSSAWEVLSVHSASVLTRLQADWERLSAAEWVEGGGSPGTEAVVPCPKQCSSDGGDMFYTLYSLPAALLGCGGVLEVTAAVLQGQARNGLAMVRSPGHHATPGGCMGFCLVNSAAVAARMAVQQWGAQRVAIVDWDVHHGNGTQDMFEDDARVLYTSLHRYDAAPLSMEGGFYPGSGSGAFVGKGGAQGRTVNIPWPGAGVGDEQYEDAFRRLLLPVLQQFEPELIIVSAGFDAAAFDPLGGMSVSPGGYAWMTHALHSVCPGRVVVVLEGGYNLRSIALSVSAVTQVLTGKADDEGGDAAVGAAGATGAAAATAGAAVKVDDEGGDAAVGAAGATGAAAATAGAAVKVDDVVASVVAAASEDTPSSRCEGGQGGLPSLAQCRARYTSRLALHGNGGEGDVWAPHGAVAPSECVAAVDACISVQQRYWSCLRK